MLQSLKIENIAVMKAAQLELDAGFNVLTGETGAGKSIVIDAIQAIMGERTSRDLIRTGAQKAAVTAVFCDVNPAVQSFLSESDIPTEADGTLMVSRVLYADGKNSCRINGSPVTVSVLKNIGKQLIDIHGQHDSQTLLSPDLHYTYIDSLAQNADELAAYREAYTNLRQIRNRLRAVQTDSDQKEQRLEMLQYQVEELEAADIQAGERAQLQNRKVLLNHATQVISALESAYHALNGDDENGGAMSAVQNAAAELMQVGTFDAESQQIAGQMESAAGELSELSAELRRRIDSFSFDANELEQVEERLDLLYRLSQKYGATEEEMLAFLDSAKVQIEEIRFSDELEQTLSNALQEAQTKLVAAGDALRQTRVDAAEKFSVAVCDALRFLDMPHVTFQVHIEPTSYGQHGADVVEFLISANAGEPPKPLAKIASGGELSRIMLAIKSVLADKDAVDTMIFDEIDTGVSGSAAQKIAQKIKATAQNRQVICVTHLGQIAAAANRHLFIAKTVEDNQTFTAVHALTHTGRVKEIARMVGGAEVTQLQMQMAEELLAQYHG